VDTRHSGALPVSGNLVNNLGGDEAASMIIGAKDVRLAQKGTVSVGLWRTEHDRAAIRSVGVVPSSLERGAT
jgi:hypothetical protein